MFDIAWSELLLIAVVALIFIGPKELPGMLQTLGRTVRKIRNSADDFRRQFESSMNEQGFQDLQKNLQDFKALNPVGQLKDGIHGAFNRDFVKPVEDAATPAQIDRASTPSAATADKQDDRLSSDAGRQPVEMIPAGVASGSPAHQGPTEAVKSPAIVKSPDWRKPSSAAGQDKDRTSSAA